MNTYAEKKARLLSELAAAPPGSGIGVGKNTSNLFRDRARKARPRIDLRHFNQVLSVDRDAGVVEAEGMTTFVDLADATLSESAMPRVVPQLKSITLGGAVAGVGIEASSFRFGLVHDTVTEMEVLTGDGRILLCTPDNEHCDLFHGLPNSYGTLGYALKLSARIIPVKRYVHLDHVRYTNARACFADVMRLCAEGGIHFLDGVVFAPGEIYLTRGRFTDVAPYASDYTFEHIYYRSIRTRPTDYLTTRDYLWRWDTDWFWCSANVGAQHPLLRRLFGRERLNSVTYQRIMRWNSRWGLMRIRDRLRGVTAESVIQDVDIPLRHAEEFLGFLHAEVGILPIWICPIRAADLDARFALYPLLPGQVYINFGFWDVVNHKERRPPGYVNRKIERKASELGGIKSLYSESYFTEEEFWATYNQPAYAALKTKYDPQGTLGDLYAKCVLRQ